MEQKTIKIGFEAPSNEIVEAINKRNTLRESRNSTVEADENIIKLCGNYFFSPLERSRKDFLTEKKSKTDEELAELNALIKKEIDIKENSFLKEFSKEFKKTFGSKELKIHKQFKAVKFNNKNQYQEYSYLPSILKSFITNPADETQINTTIFRIVLKNMESLVNKQEIIEIQFVSIVYDDINDEIVKHHWKVIGTLEDSTLIDEDSEVDDLA